MIYFLIKYATNSKRVNISYFYFDANLLNLN